MWLIIAWIGLIALVSFGIGFAILVLCAPKRMPKWFEEWACRKGYHSFKLLRGWDEETEWPTAICLWCGQDCVYMFGNPPPKFLALRERLLEDKKNNK